MPDRALEKSDFTGKVIRRDKDGYGVVAFDAPSALSSATGFFTREVLQNPAVEKACKVGTTVTGRAQLSPGGVRVLRIEPASS